MKYTRDRKNAPLTTDCVSCDFYISDYIKDGKYYFEFFNRKDL